MALALAATMAALPGDALPGLLALGIGIGIVLRPYLGLLVAALGVPFGALLPLPLGAGALTFTPLALALAFGGWMLSILQRGRLPRLALPLPFALALTLFLATQAWAAYWAPDWLAAAFETARWAELVLAMLMVAGLAGRRRALRGLLATLMLAGLLQALMGLWMALSGIGPPAFAVLGGRLYRAHGSFFQPNPFAGYMNMVWPIGAALWMTLLSESAKARSETRARLGRPLMVLALVSSLVCALALVASWSRGGWLAAAAGAGLMGLVWLLAGLRRPADRARMLALLWLVGSLGALALLGGALERVPASIIDRLASVGRASAVWNVADAEVNDESFSTIERMAHWEAAVSMWAERPWSGQGPGHYALAYPAHRLPRWSDPLGHAHNIYLNFLAESGLPGLLGFLSFLAGSFGLALRRVFGTTDRGQAEADPLGTALGLGLIGLLGALCVHSFLDNLFVHEMTVHLGLLLGLCLAARRTDASPARARGDGAALATVPGNPRR